MQKFLALKSTQHQQGSSLLEVLVALAVLSIGLLAFAELQLKALHQNQTAYYQSIAITQLASMAERIRGCPTCISTELAHWQTENSALLPHAKSNFQVTGSTYQLNISWQGSGQLEQKVVL